MPNYYGKVRCGFCGTTGHNKRGCKTYTEVIQKRYDESVASDNGNAEYWGKMLGKRTGTNPHTGDKKISRRDESYGRTCSYCRGSGHNRRKCPTMASDKLLLTEATATMRRSLLKLLRASGCVAGAMVTHQACSWDSDSVYPALILGFNWDKLDAKWMVGEMSSCLSLKCCRMDTGQKVNLPIPPMIRGVQTSNTRTMLASPAHNLELQPPAGWVDGENINFEGTDLFDKAERRDYYFWSELAERVSTFVQENDAMLLTSSQDNNNAS